MLSILYEDNDIIVVIKPAGLESQSGKSFAPDMVSEIRKHLASHPQDIHKLTKETSTTSKYPQPPYVGVIHRPVSYTHLDVYKRQAAHCIDRYHRIQC